MRLVVFSKMFRQYDVDGLARLGHELGVEGWDLAVRKGYPVNPDNVDRALPPAAKRLAEAGQPVLAVSAETDLVHPTVPYVEPMLRAMDTADVRLLKLGYFRFDPEKAQYWQEVDQVRRTLEAWQKLARRYNVKIVYHTHSGMGFMGLNAAALMHLLRDFDPASIGAYLDVGHLVVDGEPFGFALAMVRPYLSMVGFKDYKPTLHAVGDEHRLGWECVPAGQGGVAWSEVFRLLTKEGFAGPCSVHTEFTAPAGTSFVKMVQAEVAYLKRKRDMATARK
jgi:sugar phosphate isomerase/epimerase